MSVTGNVTDRALAKFPARNDCLDRRDLAAQAVRYVIATGRIGGAHVEELASCDPSAFIDSVVEAMAGSLILGDANDAVLSILFN